MFARQTRSAAAMLVLVAVVASSAPAFGQAAPVQAPELAIRSDSAPGWTPSPDQQRSARATLDVFLAALDSGDAAEAYRHMTEANRRDDPFETYAKRNAEFNAEAGKVKERRVTHATWSKDPADSEGPGVYVAFDLVSRFAAIDRHCGYAVLFQPPAGGAFQVMRIEDNYITNEAAGDIASQQSDTAVAEAWAALSADCPNYPREVSPSRSGIPSDGPIPESGARSTGYDTVADALTALRKKQGVKVRVDNGWVVALEPAPRIIWAFPPSGHPAYPSAVKRQVLEKDGKTWIDMRILCESTKAACDQLVREFDAMNASIG